MSSLPYIVGPFTAEEIQRLKKNPVVSLEVPEKMMEEIRKEFKKLQI